MTTEQLVEAKADNYHSVFVNHEGKWSHHADLDNLEDANDELSSVKRDGSKAIRLVVPKAQATWDKMGKDGIHDYVEGRMKKPVTESFLDSVLAKDFAASEDAFKSLMAEKVRVALDARRIDIAQSLYNRVQGK